MAPINKLAIIIPTFNEAHTLGRVLQKVLDLDLPEIRKDIIVVDDGSTDETVSIARSKGVCVVSHLMNRGLGAALGTGIAAALMRGADLAITFDADGQHSTKDIPRVIKSILMNQADVVIGSRMLKCAGMPWTRRVANRLGNLATLIFFGVRSTDSQSGLRAFSRPAAEKIKITANNYEVSSQICGEVNRHRLRLVEVPIHSIYTKYSLSKGQSFVMGIKTLMRMFLFVNRKQK